MWGNGADTPRNFQIGRPVPYSSACTVSLFMTKSFCKGVRRLVPSAMLPGAFSNSFPLYLVPVSVFPVRRESFGEARGFPWMPAGKRAGNARRRAEGARRTFPDDSPTESATARLRKSAFRMQYNEHSKKGSGCAGLLPGVRKKTEAERRNIS